MMLFFKSTLLSKGGYAHMLFLQNRKLRMSLFSSTEIFGLSNIVFNKVLYDSILLS